MVKASGLEETVGQERVFFNVLQKKPLFSAFWSTTTLAKEKLVKSLKVQEDGKAQEETC